MMIAMNMMLFQKKLNEDNNQKDESQKVVIEDSGKSSNKTSKSTEGSKVVIEDTGENRYSIKNRQTLDEKYQAWLTARKYKESLADYEYDTECPGEITKEDAKNTGIAAILDVAGVTGGLALPFVGIKKIAQGFKKLFKG